MRIYIIGQVGSGKSTLAKKLSTKYSIKHYELDKVIWDDTKKVKRTKQEQIKFFNKIIKQDNWIIEDVGREIFKPAYEYCDKIYYLKLSKTKLYIRVITRWLKQLLHLEPSNYKQDISTLKQILNWVNSGLKKEHSKINTLSNYNLEILTIKKINRMIK